MLPRARTLRTTRRQPGEHGGIYMASKVVRDHTRLRTWPTMGFLLGLLLSFPPTRFDINTMDILIVACATGLVYAVVTFPAALIANRFRGPSKTGLPRVEVETGRAWLLWGCVALSLALKLLGMFVLLSVAIIAATNEQLGKLL